MDRRQKGGNYKQEGQRWRSNNRKPPLGNGSWQATVPSWEKKFCFSVGSVPWGKVIETKKVMYLYENIVQWNDSAGEEAFNNAKNKYWAEINGLPCDISLHNPDLYIDEIDWNSTVDPELILDLEREPVVPEKSESDEQHVIFGNELLPDQPEPCIGWGDIEVDVAKVAKYSRPGWENCVNNLDNYENPWEPTYENGVKPWETVIDWGNGSTKELGWDCWKNNNGSANFVRETNGALGTWNGDSAQGWSNNNGSANFVDIGTNGAPGTWNGDSSQGWNNNNYLANFVDRGTNEAWGVWNGDSSQGWNNNNGSANFDRGTSGARGTWNGDSRNRESMSRYKTSRFQGNEYQTDHGWKNGNGKWRKKVNFSYERPASRQWNVSSCQPVTHR